MTTKVKICGLKSAEQILEMRGLPIDYIGFVFARSKRQVTAEQAGEAIEEMRRYGAQGFAAPKAAGVFMNPTLDELDGVLLEAPLDVIQLHGNEPPEFCAGVRRRYAASLFKAFSLNDQRWSSDEVHTMLSAYKGTIDAVLLDTYDPVYGGGSGKTFRWEVIPVWRKAAHELGLSLFVAGGLHEGNASELIRTYAPDGVDVSSGVETDGVKDIQKIRTFVERVKNA